MDQFGQQHEAHRKWGNGRSREGMAENERIAEALINSEQWDAAEERFPGDYRSIAQILNQPIDVIVWRGRARGHGAGSGSGEGRVELNPEAMSLLNKSVSGSGGLQSLLRKLQAHLEDNILTLHRDEFDRMSSYLVNLTGGGRARLLIVMECAQKAITQAGGLKAFFTKSDPSATSEMPQGRVITSQSEPIPTAPSPSPMEVQPPLPSKSIPQQGQEESKSRPDDDLPFLSLRLSTAEDTNWAVDIDNCHGPRPDAKPCPTPMAAPDATTSKEVRQYRQLKSALARRPLAVEAFQEGFNPRAVQPAHGSWLGFVSSQGDLDRNEADTYNRAKEFLDELDVVGDRLK